MTEAEDKERGVLTIDVNYIKFAQALNNVMSMCQKLKGQLDILAIERKMIDQERRNGERRNGGSK